MKLRIYIATTDGPSEIQSITEEDPDISSVVCLDGTSQALPITPGYDAFVRKPTGVIERLTGHRVYRMDVSRPISNGSSWQLGAYLAHLLLHRGCLAQKGEPANGVLFVTGAVGSRDLNVESVGHISEKFSHTGPLMMETATEGVPLTIFLPRDDLNPADLGDLPANVDLFAIDSIEEAIEVLQLDAVAEEQNTAQEIVTEDVVETPDPEPLETAAAAAQAEDSTTAPAAKGKKWLPAVAVGLVLTAGAAFAYQAWQEGPARWRALADRGMIEELDRALNQASWPWLAEQYRADFQKPAASNGMKMIVRGLRPADGKSCAGMRFRNTSLKSEKISADSQGRLVPKAPERLCKLEFELANNTSQTKQVWSGVLPQMSNARFRDRDEALQLFAGELEPDESVVMSIKLPMYRTEDLSYLIRALSFERASEEISEKFYTMMEEGSASPEAFDKYQAYGLSLLTHELVVH